MQKRFLMLTESTDSAYIKTKRNLKEGFEYEPNIKRRSGIS